jgi:autotransporter-associated beta strand protein
VTFGGNQSLTFTGQATLSGNRTFYVDNTTTFGGGNGFLETESVGDNGLGFGLTIAGSGTLILSGVNSYSGETTVDRAGTGVPHRL